MTGFPGSVETLVLYTIKLAVASFKYFLATYTYIHLLGISPDAQKNVTTVQLARCASQYK